jgi:ketosteroid isomerase-like protein
MKGFAWLNTVLGFTLLISVSAASAQTADEAAVAQAVEAMRKAVISKDRSQFEMLLADQLIYGHSDGRTETKAEYIADATGPRAMWKVIDLTNQTVKVTGDTAIVRHNYYGESVREGGKTQTTKIGVVMVWQKQAGQWKLLARQAYRT